jgi:hypothetical protein
MQDLLESRLVADEFLVGLNMGSKHIISCDKVNKGYLEHYWQQNMHIFHMESTLQRVDIPGVLLLAIIERAFPMFPGMGLHKARRPGSHEGGTVPIFAGQTSMQAPSDACAGEPGVNM